MLKHLLYSNEFTTKPNLSSPKKIAILYWKPAIFSTHTTNFNFNYDQHFLLLMMLFSIWKGASINTKNYQNNKNWILKKQVREQLTSIQFTNAFTAFLYNTSVITQTQ